MTLNDGAYELVGVAKSAINSKNSLNLSEAPNRKILQQILSASHDARIGIIAPICPMRFCDQLIEELRYMAKLTGKSIAIFEEMSMTKQFLLYKSI